LDDPENDCFQQRHAAYTSVERFVTRHFKKSAVTKEIVRAIQ
jgi:hypothetical protein